MRAAGFWTWWNGYGAASVATCVERVKTAGLAGIIVKYDYPVTRHAFSGAGIPWATERYVFPRQPEAEADYLAADIAAGAQFAVINAEVEWESVDAEPMETLIRRFRVWRPAAELYACVDTRGDRMNRPYQRVLAANIAGWMPMIYPLAFYPERPAGFVRAAFRDALDGKDFRGKPVLPTIQAYDGIGAAAVREQLAEVKRRGLPGCQAYTVAHATITEWQAFSDGVQEGDEMTPEERERLQQTENWIKLHQAVLEIFRDRLTFNDEMTRRLWRSVFEEAMPESEGTLQQRLEELERRLQAIAAAAGG